MKTVLQFFLAFTLAVPAFSVEPAPLDQQLEPLKPFLGSWRGEFKGSTPEKPIVDVMRWERALNGKAIRILHSINDGAYGGETLVTWDAERKSLIHHYFTTAGFMTKGTIKAIGKTLECHEYVDGKANGATEVKSVFTIREGGTLHSTAKYLKAGNWDTGREVTYKPAPGAEPVFK